MPITRRSLLPALTLSAAVTFAPLQSARAQENAGDVPKGQQLLADGDTLADAGKYDQAVLKYMEAYEHLLPVMRKLPFKRDVDGHFTPRKELKGMIEKMVEEEIKPEDLRADEAAMKALGLVPKDLDLRTTMVQMMSEEVAGFYDSKKETMHLIHEELPPPRPKGKKMGLLGRIFGGGGAEPFSKDESKTVLAHELTHALADQHFDLDKLQEAAKGDGDRELALTALIEGEAMLTMMAAANGDWDGTAITQIPARQLALSMGLMTPFMAAASGPTFRQAPPVLTETMIFPYVRGVVFCAHLTNADGWPALDRAYANPPLSTEQVLHPEKYLAAEGAKADAPTAVDLGELKPGGDWKELDRDVIGELVVGIMLRKHGGRTAAAGWDGDSFAVFEGQGGKLGLVWLSTWDTGQDAREFARGYAAFQGQKFDPPKADVDGADAETGPAPAAGDGAADGAAPDAPAAEPPAPAGFPAEGDDVLRRGRDGAALHVEIRGSDVAVVEGFTPDVTDALVKAAFAAKKKEKTHEAAAKAGDEGKRP